MKLRKSLTEDEQSFKLTFQNASTLDWKISEYGIKKMFNNYYEASRIYPHTAYFAKDKLGRFYTMYLRVLPGRGCFLQFDNADKTYVSAETDNIGQAISMIKKHLGINEVTIFINKTPFKF